MLSLFLKYSANLLIFFHSAKQKDRNFHQSGLFFLFFTLYSSFFTLHMQLTVPSAVRKAVSAATIIFTAISMIRFFCNRQN